MSKQIIAYLLILSIIFSLGIGSFLDENINENSLHIRQKRVINKLPHQNNPVWIERAPYVVNIQENGHNRCVGTILSSEFILSAVHCFLEGNNENYRILSGSVHLNGRRIHGIIHKLVYPHFNQRTYTGDLVLIAIEPPIDFQNTHNRAIVMFNGPLPVNSIASLSGWVNVPHEKGSSLLVPTELRSIEVPIIKSSECERYLQQVRRITSEEICTLDKSGKKYGSPSDSGSPLIVVDKAIGIYVGRASKHLPHSRNPDIYMSLLNPLFKNWTLSNMFLHQSSK